MNQEAARIADFAVRYRVSPATVWRWIAAGKLEVLRIGKTTRITREAEQRFIDRYRSGDGCEAA